MGLFTKLNCTVPDHGAAFLSAPAVRSTLDITWNCVAVLIICTWSILHLNLPPQTPIDSSSTLAVLKRALHRAWTKIKWMLITLVAPELVLGKAVNDTVSTKILAKQFDKFARADKVPWTRKHTYFANMGGFGIKFNSKSSEAFQRCSPDCVMHAKRDADTIFVTNLAMPSAEDNQHEERLILEEETDDNMQDEPQIQSDGSRLSKNHRLQMLEAHALNKDTFANCIRNSSSSDLINGYWDTWNRQLVSVTKIGKCQLPAVWDLTRFLMQRKAWYGNIHALRNNLWILDAKQLLVARELGIIDRLPSISEDDLDDRNKGDIITKALAATQIICFALQMLVRWYTKLPVTQLECMTMAFALCASYIYLFQLWKKPKDAQFTIEIPARRYACCSNEVSWIALNGPTMLGFRRLDIWIPQSAFHFDGRSSNSQAGARNIAVAASICFGLIHCAAWNLTFPTDIEMYLWRCSSLVLVFTFPSWLIMAGASTYLSMLCRYGRYDKVLWHKASESGPMLLFRGWTWAIAASMYTLARLFVLVEVFRSLAFLPPDAFISTWTANLPLIG